MDEAREKMRDVEPLHARIAELEAALKPFADLADIQEVDGNFAGYAEMFVYLMDLYAARAALKGEK
jgi:hypothetical protein